MLYTYKKVKYLDKEVIILLFNDDEALIFIEKGIIKWVKKDLIAA